MSVTVVNGASAPTTTYPDGPGNPNQGSLIYAANAAVWWFFQVNSANDVASGAHKISAWTTTSGDPAAGSWSYVGDSPDFLNGNGNRFAGSSVGGGRSVGCAYLNNSGGTNKDIAVLYGSLFTSAGSNPTYNGVINVYLGAAALTWGTWGGWQTQAWNLVGTSTFVVAGNAVAITADGYVQLASCVLHSELDCAVCTTVDVLSDSWVAGNVTATGNLASGSALVTNLSSQTNLKVGMALTGAADWNAQRFPRVTSVDSGTQVTMQSTAAAAGTNTPLYWWQGTPGSNRAAPCPLIDTSMTHECGAYSFVPLASNGMLLLYGDGGGTNGDLTNALSQKATQTQAQGFWPNADTVGASVFSAPGTVKNNDWSACGVSTAAVYAACRTAATTCQVRNYVVATGLWQAITNAPPTMTGKTIVAGGGVCLVTDGTDMWLLVIDSTDAQVKYTKYTHGGSNTNGTWDAGWTNLAAAGATAAFLTATVGNGYLVATWAEKNANATNYDTKAASLSVGAHAAPPTATVWLLRA